MSEFKDISKCIEEKAAANYCDEDLNSKLNSKLSNKLSSDLSNNYCPTKVIDSHCHIYPDAIAVRAAKSVGDFYGISMCKDGSVASLLKSGANVAQTGISNYIVHSVALRKGNVTSINDFIASAASSEPKFIGFATMHQDFTEVETEVQRAIALGLKGFKLHPDSQAVNADDPRLMQLYEIIEGRLPLILHCGDYRYDYSHPRRIKRILKAFPKLVLNAAHFGGWSIYDLALEYLEEENCYMDVSSASVYLGPRRTTELINIYGAERILFGSDFPMWDPAIEYQRFLKNELSEAAREMILWQNAERFVAGMLPNKS
ncbi:MAG: amidohydrolase [Coriobacteriales bacterium]|nr:amidohydrolase [Coriobacteriales bacterium]